MATYALWNNKGGVGKSYLSFQIACEYARTHPEQNILVLDVCPQANASSMLLGGIHRGETELNKLSISNPRRTIAGYIRSRISSPYHSLRNGAEYLLHVKQINKYIPGNLFLIPGDEELEILASRVTGATMPGPDDAWSKVHLWLSDLIQDVKQSWKVSDLTVFIDCNPSFGIYTELAMTASDRLIVPFSADGASRRAVRSVLNLLFGVKRDEGNQRSEYSVKTKDFRLSLPQIYCYVGNRLTQANYSSANAFKTVVEAIGTEIWDVWRRNPNHFYVHPTGGPPPRDRLSFKRMFQYEVVDANTASVVSQALGIPIVELTAGKWNLVGKTATVNQSQLDKQQPNIRDLVATIE
ncbi:MAG: ParA family protein [Myxococcales bacterium]|nr:ParA family protein [Myxococcales bacterium]